MQRGANIHMLVEKAMDYEKTSYRGLFNFVRYIEKLQKYEVDFGEVNLADAGSGAVQIMTIHKSKGLEFPVVFAAGMGKQFNFQDINSRFLIHPDMGFGVDVILPEKRLILATVNKGTFIYLQSLGKALASTLLSLVREVVFGVGFALILPRFLGLDGVLYSMPVSDVLTFIFSAVVIVYTYKTLKNPTPKQAELQEG